MSSASVPPALMDRVNAALYRHSYYHREAVRLVVKAKPWDPESAVSVPVALPSPATTGNPDWVFFGSMPVVVDETLTDDFAFEDSEGHRFVSGDENDPEGYVRRIVDTMVKLRLAAHAKGKGVSGAGFAASEELLREVSKGLGIGIPAGGLEGKKALVVNGYTVAARSGLGMNVGATTYDGEWLTAALEPA